MPKSDETRTHFIWQHVTQYWRGDLTPRNEWRFCDIFFFWTNPTQLAFLLPLFFFLLLYVIRYAKAGHLIPPPHPFLRFSSSSFSSILPIVSSLLRQHWYLSEVSERYRLLLHTLYITTTTTTTTMTTTSNTKNDFNPFPSQQGCRLYCSYWLLSIC